MRLYLGSALLTVRDENGFYGVQHSPMGGAEPGVKPDELVHTFGFASRPLDPEDGKGCSLFYFDDGPEGFAWLAHDPRLADKIPPLQKGGSVQYAADGSFASFDPETHTWTLYVPYADGKAHLVTVGKDGNDTPIIELASGEGPSITILDKVITTKNASGSAYSFLDDDGHNFVGPFKAAGGADLGGPTSVPLTKHPALAAGIAALNTALVSLAQLPPLAPAKAQLEAAVVALTALATPLGGTVTTKGA